MTGSDWERMRGAGEDTFMSRTRRVVETVMIDMGWVFLGRGEVEICW